jgi:tol-pal system protein YbgF
MNRQVSRILVLGTAAVCLAAAPGFAGKKEDEILRADVDEIQRQVFELKRMLEKQNDDFQRLLGFLEASPDEKRAMAEFNANVESLRGDIRSLSTKFDTTTARLAALERQVALAGSVAPPPGPAGLAPSPDGDDGALAGTTAPPSADPGEAAFQRAYGDYIKDSFDLAVSEFREFITQHPASELADNAQYWIAMSAFNQRKYEDAVQGFDQLLTRYPGADNAPEALYRKGLALLELKRFGQAVLVLEDVRSRYPDNPAAKQAAERLRELAAGER